MKLWDMATHKEIATLRYSGWVYSVSFSPDGKMLAGSRDDTVKLWDVATHKEVATLEGHTDTVYSVSFSPDGSLLASGGDDIKLWDMATHKEVATLGGHSGWVYSVSFSPDGRLLASGGWDDTVKLWDVETHKEVATLGGHSGWVYSVSFSPDGRLLASGGWDDTVKLWDMETYEEIATLKGHSLWVNSVSFSPNGCLLASGSDDGTVLLWDMTPYIPENGRKFIIPELTALPGETITVPINITDATGVASADIVVTYDKNVLTVEECKTTTLSSGMTLIANTDIAGEIHLSMAGTEGITACVSDSLIDIIFTVSDSAKVGTEAPLTFEEAEVYSELGPTILIETQNGKITIGCVKGDVNNDGEIHADDALLALRIAAKLIEPTPWQKCAADMNGDGRIRANDAMCILREAVGLPPCRAPGIEATAAIGRIITIILSEAHGVAGESITVPLKVDNINELAGGDICIAYDSAVLRAVEVSSGVERAASPLNQPVADSTNELTVRSTSVLVSKIDEPGMIRISFASVEDLNSKTIAKIRFDILADDISPLTLQEVELYQSDALLVDSRKINGRFSSWAMPLENSALLQNFPNPFNPETWIPYQLAQDAPVTISTYNVKGQLVHSLHLGNKKAGVYITKDRAAYWDGKDSLGQKVASGVYYYTLRSGDFIATRKMVIFK